MYRIDEAVRHNLKALRLERGLTQQAIADLAGVSKQTVSNIELGRGANSRTLERIAERLEVSPLTFFREPEKGVDIGFKRVSAKAAKFNTAKYATMLGQAVDCIIRDVEERLYFVSIVPAVKEMFAQNRDRLLDRLNAEISNANFLVLATFENALLEQLKKSIVPNENVEDDDIDELVED